MATTRPEISAAEDLLAFYNLQGEERARFIVYAGHRIAPENIRFEYLADDKATGEAELAAICAAITRNPANTNLYILQVLADELPNPRSKKKPANSRSITFQLNSPAGGTPVAGADPYRLAAIERKLDAMAVDDDDDDDDDDHDADELGAVPQRPADMLLAMVAGFLSQPAVQEKIIGKVMTWLDPQQPAAGGPAGAQIGSIGAAAEPFAVTGQMAADLATIATVLPDIGVKLSRLADMARNNPQQLKMIGGML